MSGEGGLEILQETLDQVRTELRATNALTKETNAKLDAQDKKLTEVDDKLVPRGLFWAVIAGIFLIILLGLGAGAKFRAADQTRGRDKERQALAEATTNRDQRVAGCERGNELRSTLRGVIERAYTPGPIPDGLSPELHDLFVQAQERALAQRAAQLADPGVQPVDCQKEYPLVTTLAEK